MFNKLIVEMLVYNEMTSNDTIIMSSLMGKFLM